MEWINFIQDLGRIASRYRLRRRLQAGDGVDYSTEDWHNQTAKAVARLHPKQMKLRVTSIIDETPSTKTFRMARVDGKLPPWRAGQYINLHLQIGGVNTSRPYSIANAPGDPYLDLTVRLKGGGFGTEHLFAETKVGDRFTSSGPAGHFHYEPLLDREAIVLLAGGSGITPMMAMLRDFANKGWPVPLHLIYGSRTLSDTIFRDELDALSANNPNLNYALVLSEPEADYQGVTGLISAELIKAHVGKQALKRHSYMICGPNKMYDFLRNELQALDIPPYHIRRELYGPPDPVSEATGWPDHITPMQQFKVEVVGKGRFKASAGEPLINSLERHGLKVRNMCRSGACSYCRVRLISGEVYAAPNTRLRESDREAGYIHACTSYPISDISIAL